MIKALDGLLSCTAPYKTNVLKSNSESLGEAHPTVIVELCTHCGRSQTENIYVNRVHIVVTANGTVRDPRTVLCGILKLYVTSSQHRE